MTFQVTKADLLRAPFGLLAQTQRPNYRTAALRLLRGAALRRREVPSLLNAAGISQRLLVDVAQRVNGRQMIRLLGVVSASLDDEFLGFTSRRCKRGTFDFMVQTALQCDTLVSAIEHCIRFISLVTDELVVRLVHNTDEVGLQFTLRNPELDPDGFLIDHLLLLWQRELSWLVGRSIPVRGVNRTIEEAPSAERLCYWIRKDWSSGQPADGFCFSPKYLAWPTVRTATEWRVHASRRAAGLDDWPQATLCTSAQIKAVMHADLRESRAPSLEAVAAALATSSQTLRRQLRHEGTGFQRLLDELRRDVAIEKLCVQRLPIADVADQLGFSESRSFSRAFKQWTGVSPSHCVQQAEAALMAEVSAIRF